MDINNDSADFNQYKRFFLHELSRLDRNSEKMTDAISELSSHVKTFVDIGKRLEASMSNLEQRIRTYEIDHSTNKTNYSSVVEKINILEESIRKAELDVLSCTEKHDAHMENENKSDLESRLRLIENEKISYSQCITDVKELKAFKEKTIKDVAELKKTIYIYTAAIAAIASAGVALIIKFV